jgi:hypothetical protein
VHVTVLDCLAKVFREPNRIFSLDVRNEDAEFFAAISAEYIAVSSRTAEHAGDISQDSVSAGVPMGVIDRFEVIEVQHDAAQCVVVSNRRGPKILELFEE